MPPKKKKRITPTLIGLVPSITKKVKKHYSRFGVDIATPYPSLGPICLPYTFPYKLANY